MARAWGPPFYGDEAAYFVNLNRNKKSVAIDLKHPGRPGALLPAARGRRRRAREPAGRRRRSGSGIDYARSRERQPRIVYCSISGFGQDGPYRDRAALDLIVQAESGMISVTGPAGGPGVRAGVSIADIAAGMFAAFGIVTALHARAANRARPVHRRLDARRAAEHPAGRDRRVPRRRHRARPVGHRVRRAAAVPDVPDEDARPRARRRQRQAVADVLSAARPATSSPTIRATRPTRRASPIARRSSTTLQQAFLTRDVRGVGSDPAGGRHSGRRDQHDRSRRRSSAGRRARRARRVRASGGRDGPGGRAAGAAVGDARRRAPAGAASRPAHGSGAARAAAAGRSRDRAIAKRRGDWLRLRSTQSSQSMLET